MEISIKMTLKKIFLIALFPVLLNAERISIHFEFSNLQNLEVLLFSDCKGVHLEKGEQIASVIYFRDGFNPQDAAQSRDFSSLETNSIVIGTSNVITGPGYFHIALNSVESSPVTGKEIYLLVSSHPEDRNKPWDADELGLFRDSKWGEVPEGSQPTPADYELLTLKFDEILIGREESEVNYKYEGSTLTTSNIYRTQPKVLGDDTPPIISLSGGTSINIAKGSTFREPGFTATDNIDGNITDNVQVKGADFDTNEVGTYTISYTVYDSSCLGTTAERSITISDNQVSPTPTSRLLSNFGSPIRSKPLPPMGTSAIGTSPR